MKLFQDKERTSNKVSGYSESVYDFLNRSGWPLASDMRIYLNAWMDRCPSSAKKDIFQRIQKKEKFDGAFFELYINALFLELNYQTDSPATLPDSNLTPDFELTKDGVKMILEAKVVRELSKAEESYQNHRNVLFDYIDKKIVSDDYFLSISYVSFKTYESKYLKAVITHLKSVLKKAEETAPEVLLASFHNHETYDDEFISIEYAIGRLPFKKKHPEQTIQFITSNKGKLINTARAVSAAVSYKAKKYKNVNEPFVIALNIKHFGHWDLFEFEKALYGSPVINIDEEFLYRQKDGILSKYPHVSGVLIFDVHHNQPNSAEVVYFINPNAIKPYRFSGVFMESNLINDKIIMSKSIPLTNYLDAPVRLD